MNFINAFEQKFHGTEHILAENQPCLKKSTLKPSIDIFLNHSVSSQPYNGLFRPNAN